MSTRQDYITAIGKLVSGDLPLGETEKVLAIDNAIKDHSRNRPLVVVEDETGTGAFDYAISLLASWINDFSGIQSVEYPVDDDDANPNLLDEDEWVIYEKPAGKYVRFLSATPETTETFRVTYTTIHTCTDTACTVAAADIEAVQLLAASYFCTFLAVYYAQSQDSTISADSVNHKSKSAEYAARAKTYAAMYKNLMGLKDSDVTPPASAVISLSQNYPGGQDRLTHPRTARKRR